MGLRHNPVTYLFLSNALLWGLPLAINHWQASQPNRDQEAMQVAGQQPSDRGAAWISQPLIATADPLLAGFPLQAADPLLGATSSGGISSSANGISTGLSNSKATDTSMATAQQAFTFEQSQGLRPSPDLLSQLRGADGLGGPITLASQDEPVVPIAARAEQLQWQRSNDALAALPLHWREPLRKELGDRVQVSQAATVRLPVPHLRERQEVPVIITDQGVAEGLVSPTHPRTREAVESWASRQRPSQAGTVQVMVIAAEPVEAAADQSNEEVASVPQGQQHAQLAAPPPLPPLPES